MDNHTCNGDLVEMFDYSQSTISQHVKVLRESGLFLTRKHEKFTFYTVDRKLLSRFLKLLKFDNIAASESGQK